MSAPQHVLSLDVGSTSIRALVFNREAKCVGAAYGKTERLYPQPGWVEYDPEQMWTAARTVISEAIAKSGLVAKDIASIGITTQRNTFLTWNKTTGVPLHNFISWEDLRASKLVDTWNTSAAMKSINMGAKLGHMISRNARLLAASKFHFLTNHVSVRLKWVFENIPQARELAAKKELRFGMIETWLLFKLTGGEVYATDYSNISSTGLFDPFKMDWNWFVINMLSLPSDIYPEVKDTSTIFGKTKAELFGAEIPIGALIADQQSALFGQCCFKEGDVKGTLGTGTFLNINTGRRPRASEHGLYPLVAWSLNGERTFTSEGLSSSCGSIIEWAQEFGVFDDAAKTSDMAKSVNDTNGVFFVPAFSGLQMPYNDPHARGAIIGLTFAAKKEHVVRAMLESIAYRFKQLFDTMKGDFGIPITSVRVDGGVSRNDFLVEYISTLIQEPVLRAKQTEQTCIGAAYLAGLATGVWKSLDELVALRDSVKIDPSPRTSVHYETYRTWKAAVSRARHWEQERRMPKGVKGDASGTEDSDGGLGGGASAPEDANVPNMPKAPRFTRPGSHVKARTREYAGGTQRFAVPDDRVDWKSPFPHYAPVDYTAPVVEKGPVWADPDIRKPEVAGQVLLMFNALDGKVDRRSHEGEYELVSALPRNPVGRTGMVGRGLLGRWGPNHAADPVVTRWQRDESGKVVHRDGKPVLEFVCIQRKDNGQWAIPGGMVEPGDTVSATLKKEFGEEAMNTMEMSEAERKTVHERLDKVFASGKEVFRGYVDDPRNTDNAWMETVAVNFHDDSGETFGQFKLHAGDDAGAVRWMAVSSDVNLYASHRDLVHKTALLRGAYWDSARGKAPLHTAVGSHVKARTREYTGGPVRFEVPDDRVDWRMPMANYEPVDYTAAVVVKGPVWADPDIRKPDVAARVALKFNELDGKVDRRSHEGEYEVVLGLPRNPVGRTGMAGRGLLGRWGPNHAADPVVTRWQRDEAGKVVQRDGKPVLEFVCIQRKDNGQWAIPGGMVEPGDTVSATLKKEFGEEAMNTMDMPEAERKTVHERLDKVFASGKEVFRGYVDDPRNTDNAWMETVAVNFHDDSGETFGQFKLHAGDDAGAVRWMAVSSDVNLYASHRELVHKAALLRNAYW